VLIIFSPFYQVWFQNQRAKVKKIQKKAKQEPPSKGASDSQDSQESLDSSLATKIKDEAHSDSESQLESPYSTTSDGLNRMRCAIKDEQEQVPFNCMETNKGDTIKNPYKTIKLQGIYSIFPNRKLQ